MILSQASKIYFLEVLILFKILADLNVSDKSEHRSLSILTRLIYKIIFRSVKKIKRSKNVIFCQNLYFCGLFDIFVK